MVILEELTATSLSCSYFPLQPASLGNPASRQLLSLFQLADLGETSQLLHSGLACRAWIALEATLDPMGYKWPFDKTVSASHSPVNWELDLQNTCTAIASPALYGSISFYMGRVISILALEEHCGLCYVVEFTVLLLTLYSLIFS